MVFGWDSIQRSFFANRANAIMTPWDAMVGMDQYQRGCLNGAVDSGSDSALEIPGSIPESGQKKLQCICELRG